MGKTNSKEITNMPDGNNNNSTDTEGQSWDQLQPVEPALDDTITINENTTTDMMEKFLDDKSDENKPPYELSHLESMELDSMSDENKTKLYENIYDAMSFSFYRSMKCTTVCEVCIGSIHEDNSIYIIKPDIAKRVHDYNYYEGDIAVCKKCHDSLSNNKYIKKAMNVAYMNHKGINFNWALKPRDVPYVTIKRSNGDIEYDWKIDESKCLMMMYRDNIDIGLFCYQDTETKLPYKIVEYQEILKLNPDVYITIDNYNSNAFEHDILCNKVIEDKKKLIESFKRYAKKRPDDN